MSTSTKQPRSGRFKSFLSSAFECFTGPRSKAYRPISDRSSSARITPTLSSQSDTTPITPTFPDRPDPSPIHSRQFEPAHLTQTIPDQSETIPINPSSQKCSTEALQTAVAQTDYSTSVGPELDVIDGTYLWRMTRYPDGKEKWLDEIKLKPNQAFRACVDPTFENCLTFLPPSQNPPTLESALRLDPNKSGMCSEEIDTEYWIIAPKTHKKLKFPFAFVTDAEVNVKGVHGIPVPSTQNGSESAPNTHGSTGCPSTSLSLSGPPPTYRSNATVAACVNDLRGARELMQKNGKGWEERPKRGSIAAS